jgi:hypothetical protein
MMTPEQARMALEAFRSRLNVDSPAAQSLTAGTGMPLEFISTAARQQAAPTEAPAEAPAATPSPVVTSGMASQVGPPAPADTGTTPQADVDALARLRQLIGGERPSQEDRGREALMNFFFSMAASRNPSFFGQLGEAGQALSQADRTARAEALQERRLDVEAAYRAAQEAREARRLANEEDPTSLRGRQLQAQTLQAEAQAEYYRRRAAEGGGGGGGRGSYVEMTERQPDGTTRTVWYNPITRDRQDAPPGLERPRSAEQEYRQQMLEDQRYMTARNQAQQTVARRLDYPALSEAQKQEAVNAETRNILENRPSVVGRPAAPTTAAPRPTTTTGRRYDQYGEPIPQ